MTDLADGSILEEHFDDVEAELDRGVAQQAEVIERGSRQALTPLAMTIWSPCCRSTFTGLISTVRSSFTT